MISSYVGENKEFERQYLTGELEVELTPQVPMQQPPLVASPMLTYLAHVFRAVRPLQICVF